MTLHRRAFLAHLSTTPAAVALGSLLSSLGAQAQADYPNRPVKLVVGFPAGGGTDVFARAVAQGLSTPLGQPFVIDNKPGASGLIASQAMLQTAPDGYNLLVGSTSTQVIAPLLYSKRPYTPADFTPVAHLASVGIVLVAHPQAPYNNVAELVAYAHSRPGQINYASGGNGVTNHLAMELLKSRTGSFLVHIPYRGSAPALQDVMAGQLPLMFDSIAASGPQIRAGKVKALGVAGPVRVAALPGVPTIAEGAGALKLQDFDVSGWVALYGPKGLPPAVVARLQDAVARVLATPEVAQRFAALGGEPRFMNAAALAAYEQAETHKWDEAVRYSGARLD